MRLNNKVVYSDAILEILDFISQNEGLPISTIDVHQIDIKEISRFKKPTLEVKFKRLKLFSTKESKVKCSLRVKFLGKGDIPYEINASCSVTSDSPFKEENLISLKTYAYVYLKCMLENDVKLADLYPRDLIYPRSDRITGYTLEGTSRLEECLKETRKIDLDVPSDEMLINVFKDGMFEAAELTKEDDEEYTRLIKKYNELQKKA